MFSAAECMSEIQALVQSKTTADHEQTTQCHLQKCKDT